jgi:hypothetical protein
MKDVPVVMPTMARSGGEGKGTRRRRLVLRKLFPDRRICNDAVSVRISVHPISLSLSLPGLGCSLNSPCRFLRDAIYRPSTAPTRSDSPRRLPSATSQGAGTRDWAGPAPAKLCPNAAPCRPARPANSSLPGRPLHLALGHARSDIVCIMPVQPSDPSGLSARCLPPAPATRPVPDLSAKATAGAASQLEHPPLDPGGRVAHCSAVSLTVSPRRV